MCNILKSLFVIMMAVMLIQQAFAQRHINPKMGGWRQMNLDEVDAYQPALDFLSSSSNELSSGYSVQSVERQVVAGFNYRFILNTQQYGLVETVIYKNLENQFKLMYVKVVQTGKEL